MNGHVNLLGRLAILSPTFLTLNQDTDNVYNVIGHVNEIVQSLLWSGAPKTPPEVTVQ